MEWKLDGVGKEIVAPINQDVCIVNLLKSVSEVSIKYFLKILTWALIITMSSDFIGSKILHNAFSIKRVDKDESIVWNEVYLHIWLAHSFKLIVR